MPRYWRFLAVMLAGPPPMTSEMCPRFSCKRSSTSLRSIRPLSRQRCLTSANGRERPKPSGKFWPPASVSWTPRTHPQHILSDARADRRRCGFFILGATLIGPIGFIQAFFAQELSADPNAPFVRFLLLIASSVTTPVLVAVGAVLLGLNAMFFAGALFRLLTLGRNREAA